MTRSMTRWMLAGCMALGAVGALAQADLPANPFAGSWSGTWSHEDVIGTWDDWTISDAGVISGTYYSITNNFGGKIVGHVSADGEIMFNGVGGGSGNPHQGTAWIDSNGDIVVAVTGTWSGAWSLVGILKRT